MSLCGWAQAADYMIGADLSFLKLAEDNGAVFKDDGVVKPGLDIFRDHGYDWIRLFDQHSLNQLVFFRRLAGRTRARRAQPSAARRRSTAAPTKPVPPVTRMRIVVRIPFNGRSRAGPSEPPLSRAKPPLRAVVEGRNLQQQPP